MKEIELGQILSFIGVSGGAVAGLCWAMIKLFVEKEAIKATESKFEKVTKDIDAVGTKIGDFEKRFVCQSFCQMQHQNQNTRFDTLEGYMKQILEHIVKG